MKAVCTNAPCAPSAIDDPRIREEFVLDTWSTPLRAREQFLHRPCRCASPIRNHPPAYRQWLQTLPSCGPTLSSWRSRPPARNEYPPSIGPSAHRRRNRLSRRWPQAWRRSCFERLRDKTTSLRRSFCRTKAQRLREGNLGQHAHLRLLKPAHHIG